MEGKRFCTCPGAPIRPVFSLKISDVTGSEELYQVGLDNFQEFIDSFAESCDLSVIISRVNAGEVNLLHSRPGLYGDFTQLPETKAEMMQQFLDAKRNWDHLSDQQRGAFGNNFSDFAASAGSEDWFKKLGYEIPKKEEVNVDAVKE